MRSAFTLFLAQALASATQHRGNYIENGVHRELHPWDGVQLSKAERRGKTAEEIQELRREKWIVAYPDGKGEKG